MRRRNFLKTVALSAALSACPGWMRAAFAGTHEPAEDARIIEAVWRRAQARVKPMLVLIVPKDPSHRHPRGRTLGAMITHGDERVMAALALYEVVCATPTALTKVIPEAASVSGAEPWMLSVERREAKVVVTAIDPTLPKVVPLRDPQHEAITGQRTARLADAIEASALLPKNDASARLARAKKELPADLLQRIADAQSRTGLSVEDTLNAATVLAEDLPGWRPALAAAAIATLRDRAPEGTYWANNSGCGTDIEGHPEFSEMVDCGMGHIPPKAARFLYFFAVQSHP